MTAPAPTPAAAGWTAGPWAYRPDPHDDWGVVRAGRFWICQAKDPRANDDQTLAAHRAAKSDPWEANARLIAAAPELVDALHEGRRAIGDHFAPNDCYATGPVTGDPIRDLVQCPACSFIAMYDAALAKARGEAL